MSFETGRVASGKSGNWMILADEGASGSERGVFFITVPRRSRLARKAESLIVEAMDKSSWASIRCLYVECFVRQVALAGRPALVNLILNCIYTNTNLYNYIIMISSS